LSDLFSIRSYRFLGEKHPQQPHNGKGLILTRSNYFYHPPHVNSLEERANDENRTVVQFRILASDFQFLRSILDSHARIEIEH